MRRFLDARAERAAGRARAKRRKGWRVLLAQRTPPLRAAAKRSRMGRRRGKGTGRDAEFTERSWGGSQRSAAEVWTRSPLGKIDVIFMADDDAMKVLSVSGAWNLRSIQ